MHAEIPVGKQRKSAKEVVTNLASITASPIWVSRVQVSAKEEEEVEEEMMIEEEDQVMIEEEDQMMKNEEENAQ